MGFNHESWTCLTNEYHRGITPKLLILLGTMIINQYLLSFFFVFLLTNGITQQLDPDLDALWIQVWLERSPENHCKLIHFLRTAMMMALDRVPNFLSQMTRIVLRLSIKSESSEI